MLGRGKGSWEIRGQQLGAAIGARVTSAPTSGDLAWADVAVIIKRSEPLFGPLCRAAGVPIIWDALDFWRQPAENGLPEPAMRQRLGSYLSAIKPAVVLGATEAQAQAAGGVYFPHHSRPGLAPTPPRPDVQVVAYEGGEVFLYNVNISPYSHRGYADHEALRRRKLLLHRDEIRKLIGKTVVKGMTLVPVRLYFKNGRVKVAVSLAKGKKDYDKRETIKRREVERETRAAVKSRR